MKRIKFILTSLLTTLLLSGLLFGQDTTMVIDANGNVGIGTTNPAGELHIAATEGSAHAVLQGPSNAYWISDAQNFGCGLEMKENSQSKVYVYWSIPNQFFAIEESGANRLVIKDGNVGLGTENPVHPLEMGSGAHVTSGGVWTDASSRTYKENIQELTLDEATEALSGLAPVKFNYKRQKDEQYAGFIAEDVPELVAMKNRKSLSSMDIVAVLTKVVQQQQKKMAELEARLDALQ